MLLAICFKLVGCFCTIKILCNIVLSFFATLQAGRKNLLKLCKFILSNPNIGHSFVGPVMKVYHSIQPKVEVRIQEIAEIISDLRDPTTVATQKPTQVLDSPSQAWLLA